MYTVYNPCIEKSTFFSQYIVDVYTIKNYNEITR